MRKKYIIDTNVLLTDPYCILTLYNSHENEIYIPKHVILELDNLKLNPQKRHLVSNVIDVLMKHRDIVKFLDFPEDKICEKFKDIPDKKILEEIESNEILRKEGIFITNDRLLQLECFNRNINCEEYKNTNPFQSESERYTGFIEKNSEFSEPIANCFEIINEDVYFYKTFPPKLINYTHSVWKLVPRNLYQNCMIELILSDNIDICTVQSSAGLGKTTLALACAFHLVFEKKKFNKIYLTKPVVEIGQSLGYLPGDLNEKLAPYIEYLDDIISKLHELRPVNRIFKDSNANTKQYNSDVFKILPVNYVRGMNIENAVVIIDECQNLTRQEVRALLSRMGENVKCICLGDTSQVDHPYLNSENNGLNWIVKLFKNNKNYGHILLKGEKSRGPICDLVIKTKL